MTTGPSCFDLANYGDGRAPEPARVAIPSIDGYGFTRGRRYQVVAHRAWTYEVINDNGHRRTIGMHSGNQSAHLHFDENEKLGHFDIEVGRGWSRSEAR